MDAKYKLKFTSFARNDMDNVFNYISGELANTTAAFNLMDEVEKKINKLIDFPYSGSPVIDDFLNTRGYRKLIINNYLAFYLIDEVEKQVVVMRILYGAMDYTKFL